MTILSRINASIMPNTKYKIFAAGDKIYQARNVTDCRSYLASLGEILYKESHDWGFEVGIRSDNGIKVLEIRTNVK